MSQKNDRVVVTGIGTTCSIGNCVHEFTKSLLNGKSGAGTVGSFDTSELRVHIACEDRDFSHFNDDQIKKSFAMIDHCLDSAISDSGLTTEHLTTNPTSVLIGALQGSFEAINKINTHLKAADRGQFNTNIIRDAFAHSINEHIYSKHSLKGTAITVATACSSSLNSIGLCFDLIKQGFADICITGGVEVLNKYTYSGFHSLRALAPKKCQPFDRFRSGLVLGEGAGILIIESMEHARKRGADIKSEILGYGSSSDAYHETAPDPSGKGAAIAMKNAIFNSHILMDDIGYINAHGTATPQNDLMETKAIKEVFGDLAYHIPISSTKSMLGHTLSAAGVLGTTATILSMINGFLPPTINYENKDPNCDLDYIPNTAREKKVAISLVNNFAFAGNNTCLVLKHG